MEERKKWLTEEQTREAEKQGRLEDARRDEEEEFAKKERAKIMTRLAKQALSDPSIIERYERAEEEFCSEPYYDYDRTDEIPYDEGACSPTIHDYLEILDEDGDIIDISDDEKRLRGVDFDLPGKYDALWDDND